MSLILVFAVVLFIALLVSELAERSIVSTAVIFLIGGAVAGMIGRIGADARAPLVTHVSELALFAVLFTEGMQLGVRDLTRAWHLPGRALLVGMPLTGVLIAAFAHYVANMPWIYAALIAAALSPTDPVFAAAIVGREEIPLPVRHLLNVESGLNDGLALPVLLGLLSLAGAGTQNWAELGAELALGVLAGVVIPAVAIAIERLRLFAVIEELEALFVFCIGLLVLGVTIELGWNPYLAAFAAGVTVATIAPQLRDEFEAFGGNLAQLLKLLALLIFGALITVELLRSAGWRGFALALLVILVARPLVLLLVLLGSPLDLRERITAAWFGPRGFASVIYGIMILNSGLPLARDAARLVGLVIVVSIVAHSSSDVPIARWFCRREQAASA
ncbi:MAG TPA: cation:proton antiporter [Thermoanaerobaculia bacterium]|jgi:NhaP-type Na+/H+ or K+/H+ antiporter